MDLSDLSGALEIFLMPSLNKLNYLKESKKTLLCTQLLN